MSLWPIKTTTPFPPYEDDEVGLYAGFPTFSIHRFVHDLSNDVLVTGVAILLTDLSSIRIYNYFFDADTGNFKERVRVMTSAYLLTNWISPWANGSFGKVYGVSQVPYPKELMEIDLSAWNYADGGWYSGHFADWSPAPDIYVATICRETGILVGTVGSDVQIWDLNSTPTKTGELRVPGVTQSIGYESKDCVWMITQEGIIVKMRYSVTPPRWEMLSSVQNPSEDAVGYYICFDSLRNRVAVLRLKEDVDRQNPSQIEFYRPLIKADALTDPVPVTKLAGGRDAYFIGHLHGVCGEGLSAYNVQAALRSPVEGSLLSKVACTTLNGAFMFKYRPPNAIYSGALELSAEISDGD